MLRVISEVKPSWIIGENVAGIINMEFEQMLSDLEVQGYEIQPLIIPACAVNAPHRRDRVWIIAHSGCEHGQGQYERGRTKEQVNPENATEFEQPIEGHRAGIDTDSPTIGLQRGFVQDNRKGAQSGDEQFTGCSESWNESWLEVAAELCRVDDELSYGLDRLKSIIEVNDGKTIKNFGNKNMRILRETIQQKEIWKKLGRLFKVDKKEILLAFLRRVEEISNRQDYISYKSEKRMQGCLRSLWKYSNAGCSPQRRRYQEQFTEELRGIVPFLPHEVALALAKNWDYLSCLNSSMRSSVLELDGFKLSKSKHRECRLKGLGNAIVPQIPYIIFNKIKEIENASKN
jgi:site-specific DNA-cytosine methylase